MAALSEQRLLVEAGDLVFERGEDYLPYVRGLQVVGDTATASIQAKRVYLVDLDWSGALTGSCTCPHHAEGNFCKHLVAVGLAALDSGRVAADDEPASDETDVTLESLVEALSFEELRQFVLELATSDDGVRRQLELREAARSGDPGRAADELLALSKDVLRTRGFIDYRRSFDVAADAQELLDELEEHLSTGLADVVRPALLHATTRLRKLVEQADDSSGMLGSAGQRAVDLYARSCREGRPDAGKLARWLVKFRADSPGWPTVALEDFVAAFDDKALTAYRRAVDKLDRDQADRDHWKRFEVDRMLLELADHDGDVDRAVELLTQREHSEYGAIIDRLRGAGRTDDVVAWMDRAVQEGRVSGHGRGNDYWLDAGQVANTYYELGRVEDALAVLRREFERRPGRATMTSLLALADKEGRARAERAWALGRATELASGPHGTGAALIDIALAEDDLDTAWTAANTFGAGHLWEPLAQVSAEARPREAAALHQAKLEEELVHANSKLYAGIAGRLATVRDLYARAGADEEFADYVAQIRERYGRRPSLMKALDRKGL